MAYWAYSVGGRRNVGVEMNGEENRDRKARVMFR
jgi:hypothetical protein